MAATSELQLAGKVALVTGATSGIGLETASALAALGATVILGARNRQKAEDTAALIKGRHPGADVKVGPELDLKSLDGVRSFVKEFEKQDVPLHILVNNAGANFSKPWTTAEKVTGLVQVNYLGAFALTRLLEKKLVASQPSRVVNVSSVTHRVAVLDDAKEFLYNWRKGQYQHTKLANALFSSELNRRLLPLGVQSCAVDPGGVNSSIWDRGGFLSRPPFRTIIGALYAPPSDGATAVVHAATSPWKPRSPDDHFFFARGMFASPLVTWNRGPGDGPLRKAEFSLFCGTTLLASFLDWPLRWMSRDLLCSRTHRVRSAPATHNKEVASDLWELSSRVVGVSGKPNV
mmetsp:Transcript_29231/g.73454  ORF Transcript_29231/g.73454 Transcript_29231/m.73454 type:complete len:347 (-) Transcript_29231:618-1658(-)